MLISSCHAAASKELLPDERVDLLHDSTDMFLTNGFLVVEQASRLLLWEATSHSQLQIIKPKPMLFAGKEEVLSPLQARPAGPVLAIAAEEGVEALLHFFTALLKH